MAVDDRYYKPEKINKIFAFAALLLLFCLMGLFAKDYNRKWKEHQKEFQALEVEKARVKYDQALIDLENNPEFKQIAEQYQTVKKEYDAACLPAKEKAEAELATFKVENDLVSQKYKFTKAELDAAKYSYEHATANHEHDVAEKEALYLTLKDKEHELKLALEELDEKLKSIQKSMDECAAKLDEVGRQERNVTKQRDLILRKLKTIDPAERSMVNQFADMVRNLPVIDLANPSVKIEQVVLKNIHDDVNFMTVPKVERCITCHLGISNPDYKDAGQPYRTHPDLELYVGKDSPHPLEEFGCTTCHGGRPRGTSFTDAVHTPSSKMQEEEWKKNHDWKHVELWEDPMLPMAHVEAGCFKCHSGQSTIKGAEKLNLGLNIIEKAGCYGCHVIDKYENWPKPGPSLLNISAKLSKDWAYKWIIDPKSFRHNTWMPSYFNQSNNDDPASLARGQQEVHAMVHYLFTQSENFELEKFSANGDVKKGEELVVSLGCFACHKVEPQPTQNPTTTESLRREHGPNLIGLGSKTSPQWIYTWLKDPNRYHPQTRMPNLRLTDEEAEDIAAYLSQDKIAAFDNASTPEIDEKILDEITFGLLNKMESTASAKDKISKMSREEKLQFSGQKLISQYGCFACHDIKGFEKAKPIGIELTEEGSKSLHKLDFGFVHIDHSKWGWFGQKLKDPRSYDKGKNLRPDEKLVMPNFNLSEQEIEAVVTALLGFVKDNTVKGKLANRTAEQIYKEEGQKIVRQLNCQACHKIEGDGGTIKGTVKDWLVNSQGHSAADAEKIHESFSPPDLLGVGKKLNNDWLFEFLHEPKTQVRPWLKVRMPTYSFNAAHLNTLIKYFDTIDGESLTFNFDADTHMTKEEYEAAEKLFSPEYFDCMKCHVVGNKMPSGSQDTWAPNLALAKTRLDPHWMVEWIKNPTGLVPGTKMPTFYDPADYENSGAPDILEGNEDEQIQVLRNYLLTLTGEEQINQKSSKPANKDQATEATGESAQ